MSERQIDRYWCCQLQLPIQSVEQNPNSANTLPDINMLPCSTKLMRKHKCWLKLLWCSQPSWSLFLPHIDYIVTLLGSFIYFFSVYDVWMLQFICSGSRWKGKSMCRLSCFLKTPNPSISLYLLKSISSNTISSQCLLSSTALDLFSMY